MKKEIICIVCPVGCHLLVGQDRNKELTVSGNKCPRGEVYGKDEILNPQRTVTAVAKINSLKIGFVPVKTDKPIPKALTNKLLSEIYRKKVELPVKRGEYLMENFAGTGANVIFTRTVEE